MATSERIGVIGGGLGGLAAACTLAARGHAVDPVRESAWLGGKAAVLKSGRLPLRHGADHPHAPFGIAADLRRGGQAAGRRARRCFPVDPQWRSFFSDGTTLDLSARRRADGARRWTHSRRARSAGYRALPRFLENRCTRSPIASSSGARSASMRDMFDLKSMFNPALLGDVLTMQARQDGGGVRTYPCTRTARGPDARSLHPVRRLGPRCLAGRTLRHRPHADRGRHLVSAGRHARRSGSAGRNWPGNSASNFALADGRAADSLRRIGAQGNRPRDRRRARPFLWRRSSPTPTRYGPIANCSAASPRRASSRRRRYEPACSGVVLYLGLDRAYDHLAHHNFVFSRDPHEEFEAIYRQGEPAPDPTCYVCAPSRSRARCRSARRRSPLCSGSHALPSAASRLVEDAARLSADDPRQAGRQRGNE